MRLKMRGAAQMQETAMAVTEHPDNAVVIDPEEAGRLRAHKLERIGRWALPMLIMALAILAWDRICVWNEIPRYILPRPGEVVATLFQDSAILFAALGVTLKITFLSLGLAVLGGVGLSMGGEVASVAGALDQRFGVVIPAAFSPDVAVYAYRHHPCWDWVHADVNEFVDVSDYHAMVAPRALVVETGAEDIAYSIAAEPFAADKQVLRRSRAAFADRPERVVHFFHPDAHSFQVGDLRVDGAPSRGVTAPELTAPASP